MHPTLPSSPDPKSLLPKSFLVGAALVLGSLSMVTGASAAPLEGPVDPSNPANPWDYLGRLHNEGLDQVATELAAHGPDPNPGQVSFTTWKVAIELAESTVGKVDLGALPIDALGDVALAREVEFPHLDREQQAWVDRLLGIAGAKKLGAAEKIEAFVELEAEVEISLGAKRAFPILAGAAVGRYSTAYWDGQGEDDSPWNFYPDSGSYDHARVDVERHIRADIGGAIMFAVGGPQSALAGAIIGSAFSIGCAIWDYFF